MSLSHTILTFLSESPHTGYDLSKDFEDAVGFFWKASSQQIYRELGKMERQGWAISEAIPQQGKPDKKLYQITDSGRQELEHWFELSCTPTAIREDLLVKVLAGVHIPRPTLIRQLKEQRAFHQEQLNCYLEVEEYFLRAPYPEDRLKFRYFTMRRGIRYETEWVEWCTEVLAEIDV
jgi:DNA-binding PadR family transcriptional regulator